MSTKTEKNTNLKSIVPNELGCTTSTKDSILQVRNLRKHYEVNKALSFFGKDIIGKTDLLKAVDNVSFDVPKGKTFGLVGESGCGKTTTGKLILQLENPTAGEIYFQGEDVASMSKAGLVEYRKSVQAVFQDPWASLNPRMRVKDIVGEPLQIATTMTKDQIAIKVGELLEEVGLNEYQSNFYPHEFSGGQRQRIGIARALALNPKLIILDEPVSALDVSIQAQVLNLIKKLQRDSGMSMLFISHDLGVVRHISDRVAVMLAGKIVEIGDKHQIFEAPQHEYTRKLLNSIPRIATGKEA